MSGYKDYGFPTDAASHVHSYITPEILQMLHRPQNSCIIDMGCGNGALVDILLNQGYDAYGIDASESGIRIAGQKHPGRFALADFSTGVLPAMMDGKAVDTIVSTEVIEHLYDPRLFIRQCKSILGKAGGELLITTPYHGYLKNLSIAVAGKWDAHTDPLWDGGHIKFWSRAKLTALLEEQGFKVIGFAGCGRFPFFWKSMLIKAVLTDG